MEVYQWGGNDRDRQQDRSTRRHARLEVPRLLDTSTRLHQQVGGGVAAVMVKFKWPPFPPRKRYKEKDNGAHSLSVFLSVLYLADPIPAKSIFRGGQTSRRTARRADGR